MIKVRIFESEKGWGQHTLGIKEFDTMEEAEIFRDKYNSKNDLPTTPDYYTMAEILC